MSNINDDLVLHLKLDKVEDGKVLDTSNSRINDGKVSSKLTLVEDKLFKNCFSFPGKIDQYIKIPMRPAIKIGGDITIASWFYIPAHKPGKLMTIIDSSAKGFTYALRIKCKDIDGRYELVFAKSIENHQNHYDIITNQDIKLGINKWYHLAGVYKPENDFRIYLDAQAQESSKSESKTNNFSTGRNLTIGNNNNAKNNNAKNSQPYYGKMSNVRIYNRALLQEEIKQVIETDKNQKSLGTVPVPIILPSYRKGHPIDFSLLDKDQNSVLYISDEPREQHILNLELKNSSTQAIQFLKGNSNLASEKNYHFELVFRPSTLSQTTINALKQDKAKALGNPQEWDVAISQVNSLKQTISLYFLYIGKEDRFDVFDPARPETLRSITLQNMSAAPGSGARGTQVELKLNQLAYFDDAKAPDRAKPPKQITGSQVQSLQIANHVGRKNIPLHVGFVGSNRILNDGSNNELNLRITNISKDAISLEGGSLKGGKFILSFDVGKEDWAIAAKNSEFNPKIEIVKANNQKIQKAASGQAVSPEWEIEARILGIKKLDSKQSIDIKISEIATSKPSGYTNLYIKYENIPGYWDGQFVCAIEKTPLLFYQNNVGIGTTTPLAKLHIKGDSKFEGNVSITGKVGIGTNNPIGNLSISNVTSQTSKPGQVIGEITFVGFERKIASASIQAQSPNRGNIALASIKAESPSWDDQSHLIFMTSSGSDGAKERMRITNDGKIGIGTINPSARLHINGDSKFEGNVSITGKVGIQKADPLYALDVDGDIGFKYGGSIQVSPNNERWAQDKIADKNTKVLEVGWDQKNGYDYVKLYTPGVAISDSDAKITLKSSNVVDIGTKNQSVTLNVNGDFHIKGRKPMEYNKYKWDKNEEHKTVDFGKDKFAEFAKDMYYSKDKALIKTKYKFAEGIVIVAGFAVNDQSWNPMSGWGKGLFILPRAENGIWEIKIGEDNMNITKWELEILFISRELVIG